MSNIAGNIRVFQNYEETTMSFRRLLIFLVSLQTLAIHGKDRFPWDRSQRQMRMRLWLTETNDEERVSRPQKPKGQEHLRVPTVKRYTLDTRQTLDILPAREKMSL
jgi:hypothetical protein